MARFVKFPGTAGSYASTPDQNRLDSDTAHIQQSVGQWSSSAYTVTQSAGPPAPLFGDFNLKLVSSNTTGNPALTTDSGGTPATAGIEYTFSVDTYSPAAGKENRLRIEFRDAGLGVTNVLSGGWTPMSVGAWQRLSITLTAAALTTSVRCYVYCRDVGTGANKVGDIFYVDEAMVAVGTDATFVPSLNIVGTLFEAFNATPTNPPIAYAADGTPLTVGVSWAGDLYTYSRHDGADATAPIVAEFNAEDIAIP